LRKITKTRGSFPSDDAALKPLYLAIKNAGGDGGAGRAGVLAFPGSILVERRPMRFILYRRGDAADNPRALPRPRNRD
jgi:hypothetical protein